MGTELTSAVAPNQNLSTEERPPAQVLGPLFTVALLEKQVGFRTLISTTADQQNHSQEIQKVLKHRIQKVLNLQTSCYSKSKRGTWQTETCIKALNCKLTRVTIGWMLLDSRSIHNVPAELHRPARLSLTQVLSSAPPHRSPTSSAALFLSPFKPSYYLHDYFRRFQSTGILVTAAFQL